MRLTHKNSATAKFKYKFKQRQIVSVFASLPKMASHSSSLQHSEVNVVYEGIYKFVAIKYSSIYRMSMFEYAYNGIET